MLNGDDGDGTGVPDEVYLLFREDPGYAESYAEVEPVTLFAKTGFVQTTYGPIPFIVWQIAVGSPHQTEVVSFVDPRDAASIALLAEAGYQNNLKFWIENNITGRVTVFRDFDNTFNLGEFEAVVSRLAFKVPRIDFWPGIYEVMNNRSVADLLELAQPT